MTELTLEKVPTLRRTPDGQHVLSQLGLLQDLAGTWTGQGFNLIARPDAAGTDLNGRPDPQNLYLQLNQTNEVLRIDPIGASIPNRSFGQPKDLTLFGLHYLQKITDLFTGSALHIEPGLWVTTQESTSYPPEAPPSGGQIIARMGSIPHGNALLAQGIAQSFSGPPTLSPGANPVTGANPAFSSFPAFNSTTFGAGTAAAPPVLNAAGSSEKLTAAAQGLPPPAPFQQYDLTVPASASNPRTPYQQPTQDGLPAAINGVPMQTVINDPITILQAHIQRQQAHGHTFAGTVLNIATQKTVNFFRNPDSPVTGPTTPVSLGTFAGGIENILFLEGGEPTGAKGPNADTALVYATFWITKVSHPQRPSFLQLQYAQMTVLNFPIFSLLPKVVTLGWPHISVATLTKGFA